MANLSDMILQQVKASAGGIKLPTGSENQILGGLSNSILGSLTRTAATPTGIDQIRNLLTGKANAATSPISALAGTLFKTNVLKGLNLNATTSNALTGLIPTVMGKLSQFIKDRDGDGDVDLNDIIISLRSTGAGGSSILGAATSILGNLLKKK